MKIVLFIYQDGNRSFVLYTCAFKCLSAHMSCSCRHLCVVSHDRIISVPPRATPQQAEEKAPRLNIGVWMPSISCQWWQQLKWDPRREGEQKRLKWIYSSPVGGWMCRRWSDDHLCSLLKWNMTARELSAISCLAQEAPIWSWVLSVLCCCVAWRCNSSCHCCSSSQCCYYFWSTTQVSWGREREREKWYSWFKTLCCGSLRRGLVKRTISEEFIIWTRRRTRRGVIEAVSVGGRRMLAAARTTVTSHRPPEKQKEATRHHRDNQRVTRGGRKVIHQKMMQGWVHSFLTHTHTMPSYFIWVIRNDCLQEEISDCFPHSTTW